MKSQIERILDRQVRPYLRNHGGDVAVVDFTDGIVTLRMMGQCAGCPAAELTKEGLIESALRRNIPEICRVVLVTMTCNRTPTRAQISISQ